MEFQTVSGSAFTIDGELQKTQQPQEDLFYFVNFGKMESVNDLIIVLQAMGFGISSRHVLFEQVKPFLDLDKGVPLPKK